MNKRGSVPILLAAAIPPIFVMGVFAIDAARIWLDQARLQAAIDAASLMVARDVAPASTDTAAKNAREARVKAMLAAYFPNVSNVKVTDPTTNSVKVEGTISNTPLLSKLTGFQWTPTVLQGVKSATRSSTAQRTSIGVELALVVDVTWSMRSGDGTNSGLTRIQSARDAALEMMKILYGDTSTTTDATKKKWAQNLYVSVVPFNVSVNYGSANTHMLDASLPVPSYPTSWAGVGTSWGGCMEIRDFSYLDATPTGSAGLRRYYWPSTYDATLKNTSNSSTSQCLVTAAYVDVRTTNNSGANKVCMGHNDWTAPAYVFTNRQNTLIADVFAQGRTMAWDANGGAHGPNNQCSTHPVLPLTMDRDVIETKIKSLTTIPYSSGTLLATGLQAGWFALSQHWRKSSTFAGWPSAEPSPKPNDGRPTPPALPLDYGTANMRKVIVLLSDGDNNWLSARARQSNGTDLVRPESRRVEFYYNAYGYLGRDYVGDDRLDVTIPTGYTANSNSLATAAANTTTTAELALDAEVVKLCNDIKKTDSYGKDQITIYAIGLGVAETAHRTLMENCVSKPVSVHYIHANTSDKLKAAFSAIAQELASLRLTQ